MKKFGLKKYTFDLFFLKCLKLYKNRNFGFNEGSDPITYKQLFQNVQDLKDRLLSLGLKKGDKVGLLASGSVEWATVYFAVLSSSYVIVPIMEEFLDNDIHSVLEHSECKVLFISEKNLERNITRSRKLKWEFKLEDFSLIKGKDKNVKNRSDVELFEDDIAEILYTSGTTGHSKAVMLSQANLVSNLFEGTDLIDPCFDENSMIMSLLPVAHAFGSTSAVLSTIYKGPTICFLSRKPTPAYLRQVCAEVKPTIMAGVPLIFEKIYRKQVASILEKSSIASFFVKNIPLFRKMFHKIAGKKVLKFLGGDIRCIIIGGASFSTEVEQFMREGKIPYVLGYGLTETSPLLTFSSLDDSRFGSVGHSITDTKIRIVNKDYESNIGEIEITGPQVMKGYYKNKEATSEVFTEDGWFITGDKGYLDNDGFLYIKGRSKNVIVNSSGENLYPEVIETMLCSMSYVEDALVIMKDKILTALVIPDNEIIDDIDSAHGSKRTIDNIFEEILSRVNKKLPLSSRLGRIIEQKEPFDKTPTQKIRRQAYTT